MASSIGIGFFEPIADMIQLMRVVMPLIYNGITTLKISAHNGY